MQVKTGVLMAVLAAVAGSHGFVAPLMMRDSDRYSEDRHVLTNSGHNVLSDMLMSSGGRRKQDYRPSLLGELYSSMEQGPEEMEMEVDSERFLKDRAMVGMDQANHLLQSDSNVGFEMQADEELESPHGGSPFEVRKRELLREEEPIEEEETWQTKAKRRTEIARMISFLKEMGFPTGSIVAAAQRRSGNDPRLFTQALQHEVKVFLDNSHVQRRLLRVG